MPPKTILVFGNRRKPEVASATERALARSGRKIRFVPVDLDGGQRLPAAELAVVFGGDGAILATARALGTRPIPILGVNLGRFGFLTEAPFSDLQHALDRVLEGRYSVEKRLRLRVRHLRRRGATRELLALNEGIVASRDVARIARIPFRIDGEPVATFSGDGLIVATPVGSTGHSLSAGGPIVEPQSRALLVTPICAHTLGSRPLILSPDRSVELLADERTNGVLTVDGQTRAALAPGDRVRFERSPHDLLLAAFGEKNYFDVLREKFLWGRPPQA